jgi:hypothetical protein
MFSGRKKRLFAPNVRSVLALETCVRNHCCYLADQNADVTVTREAVFTVEFANFVLRQEVGALMVEIILRA